MIWKMRRIFLLKIWTSFIAFGPLLTFSRAAELKFVVEPEDTVVLPGDSTILDCAVTSSDSTLVPEIKWRTDDRQPLTYIGDVYRSQLENGSLFIRADFPDQEGLQGDYQCVASLPDIGSIVSRSASLKIAPLLHIESPPRDLTVFPGQTAYFSCFVPNTADAHIVWLKDNHHLHLDEIRMLVLPSGALEIDEVQPSDEGSYQCNVTVRGQNRLSEKAVLRINKDLGEATAELNSNLAPVFIARPQSVVITEGKTVTLDCATNGSPKPWIQWLKDGIAIDMANLDSRFRKVGTGSLQITDVQERDAGTYQCRAESKADSVDSTAVLQIQVPPRFVKRPVDRIAPEKTDLEFECEVYGKPEPRVYWEKNGDPIQPSEYMQLVNGYNLRILGLMSLDAGIFQCMATNPAGNIQAAARLTIEQPDNHISVNVPSFHIPAPPTDEAVAPVQDLPSAPQSLAAVIVSTRFVTLSWKPPANARGDILAYSVYYLREGSQRERIINTTRSRLEEVNVPGLMPDKMYYFRVLAHNEHGPGASSEILAVKTQAEVHVPGPPVGLQAFATSPTSLMVRWQPPEQSNGQVENYKMFYMEEGSVEEHHIETTNLHYELTGLNRFTEYSIWVVAFNKNGPGSSTGEISAKTLSDAPSEPPQNVTLEASSSTSVIVRWEPPPKEGQNGIITGYKLRYRKKDKKRGDTVTTPANRRLYALVQLDRRSTYQVKLWALNINGTGPPTDWHTVETYENDLDESQVPDAPVGLKARPTGTDSITVTWNPPRDQTIMVRGYIIGWGKGIPDDYTHILDGKQRSYTIEGLEPNSEYVISLRANNEMGDGRPAYTSIRTKEEMAPEPQTPLVPPVGLMAIVLSARSVVVYWTDTTLSKNQIVTDNRFYVVRYTSSHHSPNPRYKYFNSTNLNWMVDDLKPHTQYEFTVKVVKGRRESPWSMVVTNMTYEERPSSPPRDLTVVPVENNPSLVNMNWQPPKQPNGPITGYLILYSHDSTLNDRDWMVVPVMGDKMTTTVRNLKPRTTFYFKIQARNNNGSGPFSNIVTFTTGDSNGLPFSGRGPQVKDGRGMTGITLVYIIVGCCVLVITAISTVILIVCCKRKSEERSKKGYIKGSTKSKPGKTNIKPPDLWIHHDQMELKALEKTQSSAGSGDVQSGASTLPRTVQDFDGEHETKFISQPPGTNSLDKRTYVSPYIGGPSNEEKTSTARRVIKPKPINLTAASQPTRETSGSSIPSPQQSVNLDPSSSRPQYPRTQYSISRAHVILDQTGQSPDNPYAGHQAGYDSVTGPPQCVYSTGLSQSTSMPQEQAGGSGTMGKRLQGHPLKSFSVPAPPPQSAPSTPQQKHIVTVRPQGSSSPYKKAGILATPSTSSATKPRATTSEDPNRIQPSYSTEELNQEMANLEGLMKDLNAITASEFEC